MAATFQTRNPAALGPGLRRTHSPIWAYPGYGVLTLTGGAETRREGEGGIEIPNQYSATGAGGGAVRSYTFGRKPLTSRWTGFGWFLLSGRGKSRAEEGEISRFAFSGSGRIRLVSRSISWAEAGPEPKFVHPEMPLPLVDRALFHVEQAPEPEGLGLVTVAQRTDIVHLRLTPRLSVRKSRHHRQAVSDQRPVDNFELRAVKHGARAFAAVLSPIREAAKRAEDLPDLHDRLRGLYFDLPHERVGSSVRNAIFSTRLYGRAAVVDRTARARRRRRKSIVEKAAANTRPIPYVRPEEAVRYYRDKVPMTRPEFNELANEVKRRAFTVAYVSDMDILHDLKRAVLEAIDDGVTLATFREMLGGIIEDRGWSGSSPWHIETVFRTNIQSAYGAGRYEQHEKVADTYPYAEYDAIEDDRTREEHAALDGTVAPIDSAFWQIHYPPWDYNCRCSAIPLAEDEVGGREIERGSGPPVENDFTSPATGADFEPDLSRFDPEEADAVRSLINSIRDT